MSERMKVTLPQLWEMKKSGQKISMITAYDYPTGVWAERAAIDILLVGDSMAMTVLGFSTTLPATMEELIAHSQAVMRGNSNSFVLGDMPYMSYQPSVEMAVQNAGRFMSEGGCDGIKLEGGVPMADRVQAIVNAGIPVMGHLGLTPQSMSMLGGFKAQGKDAQMAKKIVAEKLELVGLPGIQDKMPAELSGGMKKRVALARAIAVDPEVILYDEPTTGLDPIMADQINDLIIKMEEALGVTSLVVTHDIDSAQKVGDRLVMMHDGRFIFDGTPEEIVISTDPLVRSFVRGDARMREEALTP